jgi:hypothetical protein
MVKMNPLKWLKLHLYTIPKQAKWERENEPYPTPQELKEYKLELPNKCSKECFKPSTQNPKECSNRKTCYC